MSESHQIDVFLNGPQFLKYRKGHAFQMTHKQLQAHEGKHKVDIHLGKRAYRKLLNAVKNGKGFRFTKENITGGSLWDTFKRGASFVKSIVPKDFLGKANN